MDNRKTLHDYSIIMICLGVLNAFTFISSLITQIIDGTYKEMLNTVDANIMIAVKVVLVILGVIVLLLVLSDLFIGIKGLKVSREPNADNGYILAAKIFFALNILAVISSAFSLFDNNTGLVQNILTLVCTVADVFIYYIFIKAATAVRKDVLNKA